MIVFSSVTKQFLPDSYALKDVSFEISAGELVLLTGPSGSGKTTIMKLLTKEYLPTAGEITFHNTKLSEIKSSKVHQLRRKIGVVFQDYKLIPELNVWENIALPLSIIGKSESEIEVRITDLLELVGLTDKALYFPKQLSGGEAQRISIARALSTAPTVVFADEPTGNLDKENSLQIAKLLSKINQLGTTIIFATHDRDVIELLKAKRHIALDKGEVVSDSKASSKTKKTTLETRTDQDNSKEPVTKTEAKKPGFFARLFSRKKPNKKIQLSQNKEEVNKSKTQTDKPDQVKTEVETKKENKTKKKTKKKKSTKKS